MAEQNVKSSRSPVVRLIGFILLGLLVFTPLHSKVAGGLWFLILLTAIAISVRNPRYPRINDPVARAAQLWLIYMLGVVMLWWASAIIWSDPWAKGSADLHSGARLILTAIAGWTLMRVSPGAPLVPPQSRVIAAISMTCLMAFGWSLYVVRTNYPGNAIAWAAGIGSVICLLFPVAISTSEKNHLRLIAFLGSGIGLIALFNNQSRGVYGIVIWLLALFFLRTTVQRIQAIHSATVSAVILAIIGSTAFITTDPLRIREAWQDATAVLNERQLNTSVGVRIYLYDVALEAIAQNPITGIGPTARLSLVKGEYNHLLLQEEVTIAAASELGHVHNAYLHHLLDGGLISLTGFLLSIIGLVHIGFILQRVSRVAAHQLWGISFVHATTNLTNVNLAHNYYALMLSISIFLAFVTAYNHRNPSEASKYKTPGT